jgi:hypothetical protein
MATSYIETTGSSFVAKVRGEIFAHSHAVSVTFDSNVRNLLFGLPGRILSKHSPDFKEHDEHTLIFALHLSRLFRSL